MVDLKSFNKSDDGVKACFWFPDTHVVNAKRDLRVDLDEQCTVVIAACSVQIQIPNVFN
jgi:hypothetical protein